MPFEAAREFELTAMLGVDFLGPDSEALRVGDQFQMPELATARLIVSDDDKRLAGDVRRNEIGDDRTGQIAEISIDGDLVGVNERIYAEEAYFLRGDDGSVYTLIEIERAGSAPGDRDDFFAFLGSAPAPGEQLTVIGRTNVWSGLRYDRFAELNQLSDGDEVNLVAESAGQTSLINALDNLFDPEGGASVVAVGGPTGGVDQALAGSAGGTFIVSADGAAVFDDAGAFETLGAGETAETFIEYTIEDANGAQVTSRMTVIVEGQNDTPEGEATGQLPDGTENDPLIISASALLEGFSDPEGDPLTVVGLSASEGAVVTDNQDGTFTVTPEPDFFGDLALSYSVSDGNGGVLTGNSRTVTFVQDAPKIIGLFSGTLSGQAGVLFGLDDDGAIHPLGQDQVGSLGQLVFPVFASDAPTGFVFFDGDYYFSAETPEQGAELFRISQAGVIELVADLNPGVFDSFAGFDGAVEFGGALYFSAQANSFEGSQLYRLGPDDDLTRVEVVPGFGSPNPGLFGGFKEFDGSLYFTAQSPGTGYELYRLDADGTLGLVQDLNPAGDAFPANTSGYIEFNDTLYFSAETPETGTELFKLTPNDTIELATDIIEGTVGSTPGTYSIQFNGDLYVSVIDEANPSVYDLYRIRPDDSAEFVTALTDVFFGFGQLAPYGGFVEFADALYFEGDGGGTVPELLRLDADGTLTSVAPGLFGPGTSGGYVVFQDALHFIAENADGEEQVYALTAQGDLRQITDFETTSISVRPYDLSLSGDDLLISANDGTGGKFFRYDGQSVVAIESNATADGVSGEFATLGDAIYYAGEALDNNRELFRLDADGTATLAAELREGPIGSTPTRFEEFDGALYFTASSDLYGEELFRANADGSVELVADIREGTSSSAPNELTVVGDSLFFSASPDGGLFSSGPDQLYRLDANGALTVAASPAGPGDFGPADLFAFHDTIYFTAEDAAFGSELRRLEADGSMTTFDIELAAGLGSNPTGPLGNYGTLGDRLYFAATTQANGTQLYEITADGALSQVSDFSGTTLIDFRFDLGSTGYTEFNDALYFVAADSTEATQIWKLEADGAIAPVVDIVPGFGNEFDLNSAFATVGDGLYFYANDPSTSQIFRLDADDTVTEVENLTGSGPFRSLDFGSGVYFQDDFYFNAASFDSGRELWRINADTGTVEAVADFFPGQASSDPTGLTITDDGLLFAATLPDAGREFILFDGTTFEVIDTNDTPQPYSPLTYTALQEPLLLI